MRWIKARRNVLIEGLKLWGVKLDWKSLIITGLVCGFLGLILGTYVTIEECPACELKCPQEPLQELSELIGTVDKFYVANPGNRTANYLCINRSRDLAGILTKLDWDATIMVGMRRSENDTRKGHAWVNVRTEVNNVTLNIQFGGSRAEYPLLYSAATEQKYMQIQN